MGLLRMEELNTGLQHYRRVGQIIQGGGDFLVVWKDYPDPGGVGQWWGKGVGTWTLFCWKNDKNLNFGRVSCKV